MSTVRYLLVLFLAGIPVQTEGQSRPDFSGVWRLDSDRFKMIGGAPRSDDYQLTWIVITATLKSPSSRP